MLPSLRHLRILRKRKGLTQKQLAALAGITQAMVSRIENEEVNPSYSLMTHIFDTLEKKNAMASFAREAMSQPVLTVSANDSVKKAAELMVRNSISQLPVTDEKGQFPGSITESSLFERIRRYKDVSNLYRKKIRQVMGPPFPSVQPDERIEMVLLALHESPCVLVFEKNRPVGIITKADVLSV